MQFVEFREIIKTRASIDEEWYIEIEKMLGRNDRAFLSRCK